MTPESILILNYSCQSTTNSNWIPDQVRYDSKGQTTGYRVKPGMAAKEILTVIPAPEPESSGVWF
jgi:hypothetical protein